MVVQAGQGLVRYSKEGLNVVTLLFEYTSMKWFVYRLGKFDRPITYLTATFINYRQVFNYDTHTWIHRHENNIILLMTLLL